MKNSFDDNVIKVCDECGSEYYSHTSKLSNLCPECSHLLYDYENCAHNFENGRCVKCFWNGHTSEYLRKIVGNPDALTRGMQNEVIKICSDRLGYPLPVELIAKVRQNKWSYMGLEMIIDTVRTIEISEIKNYVSKLD